VPSQVSELVKQFDGMADVMKRMSGMGIRDRMKAMQELTQGSLFNPSGRIAKQKGNTGRRLSSAEKTKLKKEREKELRRKKRDERKK
jgi:signal recognition particle subunit SRP54